MVNRLNKIQDTGRLSLETLSNWDKASHRCSYTLSIIVNPYTLVLRKQAMEENEDKNKYRIKITQGQGEGI